jgi:hypothetical protein
MATTTTTTTTALKTGRGSSQVLDREEEDLLHEPLLSLMHEQGTSCHTLLTATTTTSSTTHEDYILLSDNDETDDNHQHHHHHDDDDDENDHHHHHPPPNCQLEPQRFAVLTVFSMNNLIASAVWITFAPIETAVCLQFHHFITIHQVNWLSMIFMAVYGPGTALCAWSTRKWGLERVVQLSSWTMTLGCILRWYSIYYLMMIAVGVSTTTTTVSTTTTAAIRSSSMSSDQDYDDTDDKNDAEYRQRQHFQWAYLLLLTGQGLVALGQPVFSNAPARVAAAWFQQTAQALGVTVFAGNVGMALGQAMSPLWVVVQEQDDDQKDESSSSSTGLDSLGTLLAGQAVAMFLCTLGTVYYFQAEPQVPPTPAEAARRRQREQGQQPPPPPSQPVVEQDQQQVMEQQQQEPPQQRNSSTTTTTPTTTTNTSTSTDTTIWHDIWKLCTDGPYMILLIAFGLGYGVNNAVLTVLQAWVEAAGFPGDQTAGICGSLSIAGGVVGTLVAARVLDHSSSQQQQQQQQQHNNISSNNNSNNNNNDKTNNYNRAIQWSFFLAWIGSIAVVATLRPTCPIWLLATAFTIMGMTQLPLLTICLDAAAAHSYPISEELSSAGLQLVGQYLGIVMINGMGKLLLVLPNNDNDDNNDDDNDDDSSSSSPLTPPMTAVGFTAPVNIAFLTIITISTALAFCYNGDDPRAMANHPTTLTTTTTATSGSSIANTTLVPNGSAVAEENEEQVETG